MTVEEMPMVAILFFKMRPINTHRQDFIMKNISCKLENTAYKTFCSRGSNRKISTHCFMTDNKTPMAAFLFFKNEAKNTPRQDFVMMNISCEFETSTYNTFCSRKATKLLVESKKKHLWRLSCFFKLRPKIFLIRTHA